MSSDKFKCVRFTHSVWCLPLKIKSARWRELTMKKMWLWRARIRLLRHYCNVKCVWSQVSEHTIGITKDSYILTWNRNDGRSSKRLRAPLQPRIFTIVIGVEINSQIAWYSYCSSSTAWQASLTWLFISVDCWTVPVSQIISPLSGLKQTMSEKYTSSVPKPKLPT